MCKITQQKQTTASLEPSLLRDHFSGFFETVATIFKHYTTHSGVIYSRLTFLRSFSFHIFSKPTNCSLEIAAFNHGFLIQSNSSLWKYRTVWTWQFIDKWHRSHVSITKNKLRFLCFVSNIWLAGFKNIGFYCFSSAIWLVFIVWVAPVSVNAL